jgi:hypothetical protein
MERYLSHVKNPASSTGMNAPLRRCPECGGLECLCRPRFFAGQLLTEEELNGLDRYIVAKNRLHNRYLHGWGVVCGLEVVCDDCGDGVVVKPGYSLSPCGDDIIVCRETPVDVCALIDACRKVDVRDCDPPRRGDATCDDASQDWVLAICYQETPKRGVMPLRGGPACGCGPSSGACGCGGGCGCGCGGSHSGQSYGNGRSNGNGHGGHGSATGGCGCGSTTATATASTTRCAPPLQCEPTVLCEGYTFRVYKVPPRTRGDRPSQLGAMGDRFMACLKTFTDAMPDFPNPATPQAQHDWCCATKDALADYFASYPPYDCRLPAAAASIYCPPVNDPNFAAQMSVATQRFLLIGLQVLIGCFCAALIPPCQEPAMDDCVPIAVVTVQMQVDDRGHGGCTVQQICNWTVFRKYATTFPSLQYWLSFLPFGRMLREGLEQFCCLQFAPRRQAQRRAAEARVTGAAGAAGTPGADLGGAAAAAGAEGLGSPSAAFHASAPTMARSRDFLRLALQSLVSAESSREAEELVRGALGQDRPGGGAYLSELESEHLLEFIMLDQMAKPLLRTFAPEAAPSVSAVFETLRGAAASGAAPDLERRIRELTNTVNELRTVVADLQRRRRPR